VTEEIEHTWIDVDIPMVLERIPTDAKSLLDLGCGRGIIGAICRCYRDIERLVGIDIYQPYLNRVSKFRLYDEVIKRDLNKTLPFKDNSFEIVTAAEVVEHLEKKKALNLIKEMERVTSRKVIITTPNFFRQQNGYDNNEYQKHLSVINWKEFSKMGYQVYGCGGFVPFGIVIPKLHTPLKFLNYLTPRFAVDIIAVKEIEKYQQNPTYSVQSNRFPESVRCTDRTNA